MSELISNDKVKARNFHATKRVIDDLGTLNDGGIFNDVYKDIYSPLKILLQAYILIIKRITRSLNKLSGYPFYYLFP